MRDDRRIFYICATIAVLALALLLAFSHGIVH